MGTEGVESVDRNEPIEEHGRFWLQGNDHKKLWGTLHVNEINEARLETFGSLLGPRDEGPHTIIGLINGGQKPVTLIGCFPTNTRDYGMAWGDEDWSHQTCLVNKVIDGIAFENQEEIAFEQATLHISTLSKLVKPGLVKLDFAEDDKKPFRINISIRDRADETASVSFRGDETRISIEFRPKEEWGWHGVITRYLVEDDCLLTIERANGGKMPLESILAVVGAVMDLLSICCNETPTITSFSVQHEKGDQHPTQVFVRMRGYNTERRETFPYPALSLENLGGIEGVMRWLEVTERNGASVGLLTSKWYNDRSYNEDNLSRMHTAVEGLLSRKKGRSRATMNTSELATFLDEAIPELGSITHRPAGEWAERIKQIRDQKISHSDPTSTVVVDGRAAHVMTNILYMAGASFLLKEIGLEEPEIRKYIQGCMQSLLLSEQ